MAIIIALVWMLVQDNSTKSIILQMSRQSLILAQSNLIFTFMNIFRLRAAVILYISMLMLCYISKKFGMVKDILQDLKTLLTTTTVSDKATIDSSDDINI
jgi:hypothetical protein